MQVKIVFQFLLYSQKAILKGVTLCYTNGFEMVLKIKSSIAYIEFLLLKAGSTGIRVSVPT